MNLLLSENQFDYVSESNKDFVDQFYREMDRMGYEYITPIGSGYCWGKHMIIYHKKGDKRKKSIARIYLRNDCIVLRLYFSNIGKHAAYIAGSPDFIKEAFTGTRGDCRHCENKKKDPCAFRKIYRIENRPFEKCSGVVFEYYEPAIEKIIGYTGIIEEFYGKKKKRAKSSDKR